MIMYIAKRWIISKINDLFKKYKGNIEELTKKIDLWICRLQCVIEQLKKINSRVSDGQLDSDEVDSSISEIEELIKKW